MSLQGLTVLVTGGTGSFGRRFVRILLSLTDGPAVIRIYSRDEFKQHQMREEFKDHERLRFFIGDVRDKERLHRATSGVDVVVHAAALKQVVAAEYNPLEAVKTNILGTSNLIDVAIDNGVARVIGVSTDKAVHPVNLYGATKLVAEKLLIQGNVYAGRGPTRFSATRYGNVVGSRGSVIPIFLQQAQGGVLRLTDERMTRFWITQEQAAQFVLSCLEIMHGGEVFVPKIPSMRLGDLARAIAPEARHEFIGIRPGEKLNEILLTAEEARHAREHADHFVIFSAMPLWEVASQRGGRPLPDGFEYSSNTNDQWVTVEEIRHWLKELEPERALGGL